MELNKYKQKFLHNVAIHNIQVFFCTINMSVTCFTAILFQNSKWRRKQSAIEIEIEVFIKNLKINVSADYPIRLKNLGVERNKQTS